MWHNEPSREIEQSEQRLDELRNSEEASVAKAKCVWKVWRTGRIQAKVKTFVARCLQ